MVNINIRILAIYQSFILFTSFFILALSFLLLFLILQHLFRLYVLIIFYIRNCIFQVRNCIFDIRKCFFLLPLDLLTLLSRNYSLRLLQLSLLLDILLLVAIFLWNVNQFSILDLLLFIQIRWRPRRKRRLYFDILDRQHVAVQQIFTINSAPFVPNLHWKSELQIQRANLAKILLFTTKLADGSSLIHTQISFPLKNRERSETDSALLTVVLFKHSHVRICTVAFVTRDWEIRRFPTLLINIHSDSHISLSSTHWQIQNRLKLQRLHRSQLKQILISKNRISRIRMENQNARVPTGFKKIFLISKQQLASNTIQKPKNRTWTHFKNKRLLSSSKLQRQILSTVSCERIQKPKILNQKFKKFIGTTSVDWGKWNINQKQRSTQKFIDIGKRKSQQKQNAKLVSKKDAQILKLRHKIREVLKLRQNIDKGHRNNLLIAQLSQQSEQKVNRFFEKFEDQINRIT